MKHLLFILFTCLIFSNQVKAASFTVTGTGVPGQYFFVFQAIAAASDGDTIYMTGHSNVLSGVTCNKRLTFIGPGFKPDKQNPLPHRIEFIHLAPGSEGSKIAGLIFTNPVNCTLLGNANITYENCLFENNTLNFTNSVSNVNIYSCLFLNSAGTSNLLSTSDTVTFNIRWCIFDSPISTQATSTWSGEIDNSLFLGTGSTTFITNAFNLQIFNNIYYGTIPLINGTNSNTLAISNLSFGASNNNFNANVNSNNFVGTDPLFITYAPPGFSYLHDYHLQSVSAGHNQGWNNSDIGVYGNSITSTSSFKMSGEPSLVPVIRQMNIVNTTVVAGTPLNVNAITTVKP